MANINHNKEKDMSYKICKKCGKEIELQGTHEYGFYFECTCEKQIKRK